MSVIRIQTPGRLHFGLLGWGRQAPRQFGGVGLMVRQPGIVLRAQPAKAWRATGPNSERVLHIARTVMERLGSFAPPVPLQFDVDSAPAAHTGLGTGTQLALSIAQAVAYAAGRGRVNSTELAQLAGRGLRSGVGLHGFDRGGLVVDGGRGANTVVPPMVAHLSFPPDWNILIVIPALPPGRHGPDEIDAFGRLSDVPIRETERMSRLVLMSLLPAVAEVDLLAFGEALAELQLHVGRLFAPAQGGEFAHRSSQTIAQQMRDAGLHGVGQSSWGPALYGFTDRHPRTFEQLIADVRHIHGLGVNALIWTQASSRGATCEIGVAGDSMSQFS